jgi:type IV pilus assembly protein PilY1
MTSMSVRTTTSRSPHRSRVLRARRRFPLTRLVGAAAVAFTLAQPQQADAQQLDVNPPLPNVMILLDTSGSMEKMISGADPSSSPASTCNPGVASSPNRWGVALQALTGDVLPYYSCSPMSRASGSAFDLEYRINGLSPYDVNYYLPFHRPVSGTSAATACVLGPGVLPGSSAGGGAGTPPSGTGGLATDFPTNAIVSRLLNGGTGSCTFQQSTNGILDSARDIIRFGLMTFDQDTASGTGSTTSPSFQVANTPSSPFAGSWSYFDGWKTAGNGRTGQPANCAAPFPFELGARNPAAPPWEGRLIGFPTDPDASIVDVQRNNDNVQLAIAAMRPYGATPIAALLDDAKYYFWDDPDGPQRRDPYVQGQCRDQYIILLTDGAPNQDMRPQCAALGSPNGVCPYALPEDSARALYQGLGSSGRRVTTFVIGFAVSSIQDATTNIACSSLVTNGTLSSVCSDAAKQELYGPCCTLQKIAIAGGSGQAYFADSAGDLNRALGEIIAKIGRSTTTRTVPAYSPVITNPASDPNSPVTNASLYLASFIPSPGKPWSGNVQRQRFVCTMQGGQFTVPEPVVDASKGDDFAANLNSHAGALASRRYISVAPAALAGSVTGVDSTATIRPFIGSSAGDQLGTYGGTEVGPNAEDVLGGLAAGALGMTSTTRACPNRNNTNWLTASSCARLALNFAMGQQSTDPMPDGTFAPFESRYDNAFGDVFRSTPVVVGPPNALIRDESYQVFRTKWDTRKTVLYTATNDGLLHAFWTDVDRRENNELWAMIPPAVLPKLISTYPASRQILLDGAPIVKDVVWERSRDDVSDPETGALRWHTMLVAGFGAGGRGYYAVDVTDPDAANFSASDASKGPHFRWQLTTMPSGERELFGQYSVTPAITSITLGSGTTRREVGVAILPGGSNGSPSSTAACTRAPKTSDSAPPSSSGFAARTSVRCWGQNGLSTDPVPGRSLSIVRVDTGEVIRTFMREADAPQSLIAAGRVIDTPLDSPMTGIPVVYPAEVGAPAQKIFIGDADGTIWKFDVSAANPDDWRGELFFDTVNATVDTTATAWQKGQPINVAPVLALDRFGNLVLEVATGDQETYTRSGTNYVYSLTEKLQGTSPPKLRAAVNWYLRLADGERVSGPMAVFDNVFYFATFQAADSSVVCSGGTARLYGRDFVTPANTNDLAEGGIRALKEASDPDFPPFIVPSDGTASNSFSGKVIPGVSISVTPSCADLSRGYADPYVGGTHYAADSISSGGYSLIAQVGTKGTGSGGTASGTYSRPLATPQNATVIDSWAAVVE